MDKWMAVAYKEAVDGMDTNEGGPFGAVIVKGNKIISSAHNEVLLTNDPTAHAEIIAIRKASEILSSFDLSECVLYTTCKPCPMCMGAIFWARIKTVYYGATEEDAARGGFDDKLFYELLEDKNNIVQFHQIEKNKNSELFLKWLEKEDKRLY